MRRDVPAWLPFVFLALALVALFHRLLSGQALFWGLPALQFYPWRDFAFDLVREGRLPTWNPYVGAGAPLLANYQTAIFYPPNWLMLALPGVSAMSAIAVLHVVWSAVGMWLFAGALGLSSFGRGISTLAYALSGYLIGRAASFPTADAAAWIPWVFWLVERVLSERRARDAGWLGIAFGMQLLAGHAQTTWYGGLMVGAYAVWVAARRQRGEPVARRVRGLALAGAGAILGALIAAIQLVPTLEYFTQSSRSEGLSFEVTANLSYPPLQLLTLLNPNFFGTPADGSYLAGAMFFENHAYIGFVPLLLAGAGVVGWLQRRRFLVYYPTFRSVPFWAGLALVTLVLAFGSFTPIYRLLYEHVPTFDFFREPVRWMIAPVFSLSVLAGIGTGNWRQGKWALFWARLALAGGGAIVALSVASRELLDLTPALDVLTKALIGVGSWTVCAALLTLVQPSSASLASPLVWRLAVLALVTIDLAWGSSGLNPTVSADFYREFGVTRPQGRTYWFEDYEYTVKYERFFDAGDYVKARDRWPEVRGSLLPNLNMLDHVASFNNFDPLLPDHHRAYLALIEEAGADADALLRAAGVSQVFGETPVDGWQGEAPVFFAPEPPPSVWLVPVAEWYADDAAVQDALRDPTWDPFERVILLGDEPVQPQSAAPLRGAEITTLDSAPDRVTYRVRTENPAYLVIATTWYPGWHAELDGEPAPLYRANLAFQAVAVPEGGGDVTLRYTLNHWTTGLGLTGAGMLIAIGLIAFGSLGPLRRNVRPRRSF